MRLFEKAILPLSAHPVAPAPDAHSKRFSSTAHASVRALSGRGRPQLFSSPYSGAPSMNHWDVNESQLASRRLRAEK